MRSRLMWWALAALVVVVYARVLGFAFLLFDDPINVVENPRLAPPTAASLAAFWSGTYLGLYVPVAYSLWWLAAWVGDAPQAWLYHALPLVCQVVATLLCARWLLRLGLPTQAAWLGALFWAMHPLQAETVAWVSELRGAAANAFVFLYLERSAVARSSTRHVSASQLTAYAALLAALLCKPSAAVAPAVLCVVECAWWGSAVRWRPLFVAGVCAGGALWVSKQAQADELLSFVPDWSERVYVALDALGHYARTVCVPVGLAPDYGRRPQDVLTQAWSQWEPWLGVVLVLLALWAVWQLWRGYRSAAKPVTPKIYACAALVFPLCLAPTLGFVSFAHQSISTVADRYASLALVAPALLVAALATRLSVRWAWASGLLLLTAMALLTAHQTSHWRDTRSLFLHTTQVNPLSATAWTNLGLVAERQGNLTEARESYQTALRVRPEHARAHQNLGLLEAKSGNLPAALQHLLAARSYQPYHARHHSNLAAILSQTGDPQGALAAAQRSLELDPELADGHNALGVLSLQRAAHAEALQHFQRALALRPPEAEYARNCALAAAQTGQVPAARAYWERALSSPAARASWRLDAARTALSAPPDAALALRWTEPLVGEQSMGAMVVGVLEVRAQAWVLLGERGRARAELERAMGGVGDEVGRERLRRVIERLK
jgi:tetratricopeptide (TPR) repeat protein